MKDYAELEMRLRDLDWHNATDSMRLEAADAISDLTKRLEEAQADAARLDWLDSANVRLNAKYGTRYKWQVILNHNVARLMLGDMQVDLHDTDPNGLPSCRDAIDAARKPLLSRERASELSQDENGERVAEAGAKAEE